MQLKKWSVFFVALACLWSYVAPVQSQTDASKTSGGRGAVIAPSSREGRFRALLIGVNDYQNLQKLKFCENDVMKFHDTLVKLGAAERDIFTLVTGADDPIDKPTHDNIKDRLDLLFRGVSEDDVIIIALSGHGASFPVAGNPNDNVSFFCSQDTRIEDPQTMISVSDINERLDTCPAKFKMLFVDACRNTPLVLNPGGGRSAVDLTKSREDGFSKSWDTGSMPRGTIAFLSCISGQQSWEFEKFEQGAFMYFVVKGCLGAADFNGDGEVSVIELRDYVMQKTADQVRRERGMAQNPMFISGMGFRDETLFRPQKYGIELPMEDELTETPRVSPTRVSSTRLAPTRVVPPPPEQEEVIIQSFGDSKYVAQCVAFSRDGRLIASGGPDCAAKVWDVSTGKQLTTVGHAKDVSEVCFSQNGDFILSTSLDGTAKISRTTNGESTWKDRVKDSDMVVTSGMFSPDSKYLAIGTGLSGNWLKEKLSPQNAAVLYDTGTGKIAWMFVGHLGKVNGVAFSPDGKMLASGSSDKTIGIWDVQNIGNAPKKGSPTLMKQQLLRTLLGHSSSVKRVEFSNNGNWLASLSDDDTVRIWDYQTGAEVRLFSCDNAKGFSFSPDDKVLATCSNNYRYRGTNTVRLWNTESGAEIKFPRQVGSFESIAFSPDGKSILLGASDDTSKRLKIVPSGL